jgi:regulator of protease activity HflC (stomatin/prohibitin superfamily)
MASTTGDRSDAGTSVERPIGTWNGFATLAIGLALLGAALWRVFRMVGYGRPTLAGILLVALLIVAAAFVLAGLYTLQPNEAAILQLFGAYRGTSRAAGLRGTNPFYTRTKRGNPIEIAAVVVWHVADSAKATFDVDDYENFVKVQSEAAVRHLASSFAYDDDDTMAVREPTLLGSAEAVARALEKELQARLDQAGVIVEEARLTHLAYAPEIAQVMLRRQQAEAIIAARQKIVHGAVSMVEMALSELSAKKVVDLDDERRAAMVSNLMTVLCAEGEVQPVINTGTLYS